MKQKLKIKFNLFFLIILILMIINCVCVRYKLNNGFMNESVRKIKQKIDDDNFINTYILGIIFNYISYLKYFFNKFLYKII